jgi:hypothetical protein
MSGTLTPQEALRQNVPTWGRNLVAGFARAPVDIALGLPAALSGSQRLADMYDNVTRSIADYTQTTNNPRWDTEPVAAATQTAGGLMLGVPGGTLARLSGPARAAADVLGGVIGVTPSYTLRSLATTGAIAAGAGVGVEKLADAAFPQAQAAQQALPPGFEPVAAAQPQLPAGFEPVVSSNLPPGFEPVQPAKQDASSAYVPTPPDANPPRVDTNAQQNGSETARNILGYLPYVAAGAIALGAGGAGYRLMQQGSRQNAAMAGGLVRPGGTTSSDPVQALGPLGRAYSSVFDNSAAARSAIEEWEAKGTITSPTAQELTGSMEINMRAAPRSNRIDEAMRTGELSQHVRVTPVQATLDRVSVLDRTDTVRAQQLRDALAAGDELDNRRNNAAKGIFHTGNQGEGRRLNFDTEDSAGLQSRFNAISGDADLTALRDDYYKTNRAMSRMLYDAGLIDQQLMHQFNNSNPRWVHTLADNIDDPEFKSVLMRRDRTNGDGVDTAQDPFTAQVQAMRETMNLVYRNQTLSEMALQSQRHMQSVLAANPNAKLWSGGIIYDGATPRPGMATVPFRQGGKLVKWEVSPEIAAMMRGGERATVPFLTAMNRLFQAGTTGTLAAVVGAPFAHLSALIGANQLAVNRPLGTNVGVVDAAVQRATGGRIGMPFDPTLYAGMASSVVRDGAAAMAFGLSNMARRELDQHSVLTQMLGPQRMQQFSDRMAQAYVDSLLHERRALGVSSLGMGHGYRVKPVNDPGLAQLSPEYVQNMPYDWAAIKAGGPAKMREALGVLGTKMSHASLQRTWNMATQLLDIIAESPQSTFYRRNRNVAGIAGLTRRTTGDPAAYGSNRFVQGAVSTMPYANITLQGINAMMRGVRRDGWRAVSRMVAVPMMTAGLTLTSAILADMEDEENGIAPHRVQHLATLPSWEASRARIYLPGVSANDAMVINGDPINGPMTSLAMSGMLSLLGANDPRFFGPEGAPIRRQFAQYMQERAMDQFKGALASAGAQVSLPPVATAGAMLLTGADISPLGNFTNPRIGMPPRNIDEDPNNPVSTHVGKSIEAIAGIVGRNSVEMARTFGLASQLEGGNAPYALSQQYALNLRGQTQLAGPLLQPNKRLPQTDAVGEALRPTTEKLTAIAQQQSRIMRPGTVGAGKAMALAEEGTSGKRPINPQLVPIAREIHMWNTRAVAPIQQQIRADQERIQKIEASPAYRNNPEQSRTRINELVASIRARTTQMYGMVRDYEDTLSRNIGRRVRIEALDLDKGMDQFSPMQ